MITDQVEESGLDRIRNKVPATLPTSDFAVGDLRCCDMTHMQAHSIRQQTTKGERAY